MADQPPPKLDNGKADIDLTGRRLGDYHLLRRLGRGGMAEVWLAEQTTLRRQVAFKVLKSDLANDDLYIKRFQLEAQAAAQLVHANIVQIFDVGCIDGVRFIAQEYVQGQNLREYLVKHGPPDVKLSLTVMRQVAAALYKAAEAGVVHRDIKPDNIMLARSGEVKVADFGLARVTGDGEGLNLTRVGMTMGTPLYMSPEQVEGKQLDSRSDIYSFGVTCYHMLAGTPPFRGETALSVAVQHLKTRPEPLETVRPDLPGGLCRVVHKMLSKEPGQRYSSAREILRELRNLKLDDDQDWDQLGDIDLGVSGVVSSQLDSATARLGSLMKTEAMAIPRRPRWWLWATVVVLGFFVGGFLGWLFRENHLLAGATPHKTAIPKKESVEQQFYLAMQLNSERGWRSVLEHYPEKEYYVRRASQQLSRYYLRHGEYEESLKLFDELANLPDTEPDFRAFGLTGQTIIHLFHNRFDRASATLEDLGPIYGQLSDSQLQATLLSLLKTNQGQMTAEARTVYQKMLDESSRFREDPSRVLPFIEPRSTQ